MRAMLASFELDIRPPPPSHKTEEFILRTTTIKEVSIDGNIRVNENIYIDQLKFENNGRDLNNTGIPGFHDKSTNARICGTQIL
jgi:hypothetical protein